MFEPHIHSFILDKSSKATQTGFLKIKLVGNKLSQPLKKSGATNFFYSIDPSISIRDYARVVRTHFLKSTPLSIFFFIWWIGWIAVVANHHQLENENYLFRPQQQNLGIPAPYSSLSCFLNEDKEAKISALKIRFVSCKVWRNDPFPRNRSVKLVRPVTENRPFWAVAEYICLSLLAGRYFHLSMRRLRRESWMI